MKQDIPGTIMFDGDQAQKGLALNRMCFSFNSAAKPGGISQGRGRLLRKIRPRRGAARSGARAATCCA